MLNLIIKSLELLSLFIISYTRKKQILVETCFLNIFFYLLKVSDEHFLSSSYVSVVFISVIYVLNALQWG